MTSRVSGPRVVARLWPTSFGYSKIRKDRSETTFDASRLLTSSSKSMSLYGGHTLRGGEQKR